MTSPGTARYDGQADWYAESNRDSAARRSRILARLLGPGQGPCLDLGCGPGQYLDAIRGTGRTPVGLDCSADQLRLAAGRPYPLVRADAARLPLADSIFPTVALVWVSTDVDDFGAVVREAARVLEPGGVLVVYGAHPCFNGPAAQNEPDGRLVVHPVYRDAGWHSRAAWWKPEGLRRRVGVRHIPLADYLNAFPAAGLTIERVEEPGDEPVPIALAVRARR
ncbi:class I SAM-dependent methyltransferase [Kineosporia succinea]|uniref:SAM-dependent methyltransferase n=1 Tax=Kineosporia succinea TaxID=84632 RepID=A0ABT9PEC3_9ACTN|nr:class I SAM-dependent methyltransferase [Kineosporia succinea]MDP9830744.1 SAM-dependent methyltransferase [Kineosporia succinea]